MILMLIMTAIVKVLIVTVTAEIMDTARIAPVLLQQSALSWQFWYL